MNTLSPKMQTLLAIDEMNKELQERNAKRLAEAKERMGTKYILHPDHKITREKFQQVSRITGIR